ncbi:MAG: hypothetical protein JO022_02260, partial [Acidobacteriaceae bacterium]|nr:hypothetical protein [Acidobacteriaceae bacterium]
WANLHGGFAMFLALLGVMVGALAVEGWMGWSQWHAVRRYGILLAGCSLATVINPFGLGLHRHMLDYLRSDWINNVIQEFQAPTFRGEGQAQFEWILILGLLMATRLIMQRRVVEALWIIFLAHSSLISLRHAPLYAAVASPILAAELSELWKSWAAGQRKTSLAAILNQVGTDLAPAFRRSTVWVGIAVVGVAIASSADAWPTDFPKEMFPIDMVQRNVGRLAASRVLTTDQWADYLIFSFYPKQKVFFDGRSDFYGEKLGRDYLALMQGTFATEKVLRKYSFDFVLIPVEWPLAESLKQRGDWAVLEDDGKSILFGARKQLETRVAGKGSEPTGANGKFSDSRTTSRRAKRA